MKKRPAKYIRIAVSVLLLTVATAFAVGCGSLFGVALNWIESVQFVPTLLTVSGSVILFWLVFTFLFGRLYCSSVCPLGTMQDIILRLPRFTIKQQQRRRFKFSPSLSTLRLSTLVVVFGALIAGFTVPAYVLDPFGIFNGVVRISVGRGLAMGGVATVCVTVVTFLLIAIMAVRRGRLWCNTLCPVGSIFGLISTYSVFKFDINTDLCTNCRKCEDACKAQCINLTDHTVDGSRCVGCFNCTNVCPDDAISYTSRRHRLSWPMMQRSATANANSACDGCSEGFEALTDEVKIDSKGV